ncbi:MAG: hypothetical protein LBP38_02520 [Desulfovibrio sp.]|jgi:hypothetical protein|nr:hypothetical protein [Desulfovibrio sp.]
MQLFQVVRGTKVSFFKAPAAALPSPAPPGARRIAGAAALFRPASDTLRACARRARVALWTAAAALLLQAATGAPPAFAAARTAYADGGLFSASGDLRAVDPLLTIFYNASTFGETRPCPTCGNGAYGGMARRIGLFRACRDAGKSCLVLAGPYEFTADDPLRFGHLAEKVRNAAPPPAAEAVLARKLQAALRVDAGWISRSAAAWLNKAAGGVPAGYLEIGEEPRDKIVQTPAGPVGVVFFPEGPVPGKGPRPEQARQVLERGRKLRAQVPLLIGISPWGLVAEKNFLPEAGGIFDCILGGGEGVGFGFSLAERIPGLIWLRPDGKGRAVNVLELNRMPDGKRPFAWEEGRTFNARLDFMGENVPADKAALELIRRQEAGETRKSR